MEQIKDSSIINIELKCKNSKQAYRVCFNAKCKQDPFLCVDLQCECQLNTHIQCPCLRIKYLIMQVIKRKQQMPSQVKKAFEIVKSIYRQAIDQLSKDLAQLQQKMEIYGLKQYQQKFYNLITNQDIVQVSGQFMSKLKQQVQKPKKYSSLLQEGQVKSYWQKKEKQFNIFRQSIKLLVSNSYSIYLDSKITNDKKYIMQLFDEKVQKFKLLYRASQNNFQVSKFHKLCDNKPNTLTIVETQFGKIIGGYTSLCWNQALDNTYVADPTRKSFLFSLSNKQQYPLITIDGSNAILCYSVYGPIFGSGQDLYIGNNSNVNNNSGAIFGVSYNNGKYQQNQSSYKSFGGSVSGWGFKIKEWEVFQVQF